MPPGNVSYKEAKKTGCSNAGSTLKLSKDFCLAILMKLRKTATIKLLRFVSWHCCHLRIAHLYFRDHCDPKETHSSSVGDFRAQREKEIHSEASETTDKKEKRFFA